MLHALKCNCIGGGILGLVKHCACSSASGSHQAKLDNIELHLMSMKIENNDEPIELFLTCFDINVTLYAQHGGDPAKAESLRTHGHEMLMLFLQTRVHPNQVYPDTMGIPRRGLLNALGDVAEVFRNMRKGVVDPRGDQLYARLYNFNGMKRFMTETASCLNVPLQDPPATWLFNDTLAPKVDEHQVHASTNHGKLPSVSTFDEAIQANSVAQRQRGKYRAPPRVLPSAAKEFGRNSVPPRGRPADVNFRHGSFRRKAPSKPAVFGPNLSDIDLDNLKDHADRQLARLCARATRGNTELTPMLMRKLHKVLFYLGRNQDAEIAALALGDSSSPEDDDVIIEPTLSDEKESANVIIGDSPDLDHLRLHAAHAIGVDADKLMSCDADALTKILDNHVESVENSDELDFH